MYLYYVGEQAPVASRQTAIDLIVAANRGITAERAAVVLRDAELRSPSGSDVVHNGLQVSASQQEDRKLTAEHGPHEVVKRGEFQVLAYTTMHLTDPPEWGGEYAHEMVVSFHGKGETVMGFGATEGEAVVEALHLAAAFARANG